MAFIIKIVVLLFNISQLFYRIYLEVHGWWSPFSLIAPVFYEIKTVFSSLAWQFYHFGNWLNTITAQIGETLSWDAIKSYILNWLPDLENAINWFLNSVYWINAQIISWWNNTVFVVQNWINIARDLLQAQVNNLTSWLANLQNEWDTFKKEIPDLSTIFLEINTLIGSWFKQYQPFWEGWLDWKNKVIEFFTDPLEWVYNRIDEWFERYW